MITRFVDNKIILEVENPDEEMALRDLTILKFFSKKYVVSVAKKAILFTPIEDEVKAE